MTSRAYQCSGGLKNFSINRFKSHDIFSIPEIMVYEVYKCIGSVGSKNVSGCDGISGGRSLLSLPYTSSAPDIS